MATYRIGLLVLAAFLTQGCGDSTTVVIDAGRDSGGMDVDAGLPPADAGTEADMGMDGGTTTDAGSDAGSDAGTVPLCTVVGTFGPTPYLSRADSPFDALAPTRFVLRDFEDAVATTDGVTACSGLTECTTGSAAVTLVGTGGGFIGLEDSVDGDDGTVDGMCVRTDMTCHTLYTSGAMRFDFAPSALDGALPTIAGLVWTDGGGGTVTFEALAADGSVIATIGPSSEAGVFPDAATTGQVAEDRFFGVCAPDGIAAIRIINTGSGLEIDHLQFGR